MIQGSKDVPLPSWLCWINMPDFTGRVAPLPSRASVALHRQVNCPSVQLAGSQQGMRNGRTPNHLRVPNPRNVIPYRSSPRIGRSCDQRFASQMVLASSRAARSCRRRLWWSFWPSPSVPSRAPGSFPCSLWSLHCLRSIWRSPTRDKLQGPWPLSSGATQG